MPNGLDWGAHYYRKRRAPIISQGQIRDFKREGQQLAERIKKGKKSPRAGRDGQVRQWSPDEIAEWATINGMAVSDRMRASGVETTS